MTEKKTIYHWGIIPSGSPYLAPELWKRKLHGILIDPECPEDDDHWITTSSIVGKRGDCIVTNSGSEYLLGEVNPSYERSFPNARERLFNSLKEV